MKNCSFEISRCVSSVHLFFILFHCASSSAAGPVARTLPSLARSCAFRPSALGCGSACPVRLREPRVQNLQNTRLCLTDDAGTRADKERGSGWSCAAGHSPGDPEPSQPGREWRLHGMGLASDAPPIW